MSKPAFIAGDWGTSHLRLSLCDQQGQALANNNGPGVAQIENDIAAVFFALIAPWVQQYGALPTVLCGMVGSNIGWTHVPYLPCPAQPAQIAEAAMRLEGGQIAIAPGLSCKNVYDAPDVLRGEETQVLGALRLDTRLQQGRRLLCLPGTHTKWVVLEGGIVQSFLTAVSGELYSIVKQHSVLIRDYANETAAHESIFQRAISHIQQHSAAALPHLLFECRSRQLAGELTPAAAAAYLSGLLIAADVGGALRAFTVEEKNPSVMLVGAPQLTGLYVQALAARNIETEQLDGARASLAGLTAIYAHLYGDRRHAI